MGSRQTEAQTAFSRCIFGQAVRPLLDTSASPRPQNSAQRAQHCKHAVGPSQPAPLASRQCCICNAPGRQLLPQGISNSLLACAELRLSISLGAVAALTHHLLDMHASHVSFQEYCNTAWSLAVMGSLSMKTFDALLQRMTFKLEQAAGGQHVSKRVACLSEQDMRQLHQALAWLQPPAQSQQVSAWEQLQWRLRAFGPPAVPIPVLLPSSSELCRALTVLGVQFDANVPLGLYWANAVLHPTRYNAPRAILVLRQPDDYLINAPSRCTLFAFSMSAVAAQHIVAT